jgi:hypothetical protein
MKHFHIVNVRHIRKSHYRRCVAVMIFTVTVAHYLIPQHEHWVNLATNLVWLFDPTEA